MSSKTYPAEWVGRVPFRRSNRHNSLPVWV